VQKDDDGSATRDRSARRDPSFGIRRWASWALAGIIFNVVAFATLVTFRVGILGDVAGFVQPITIAGLAWSLRLALPQPVGRRAVFITILGLVAAALLVIGHAGARVLPGMALASLAGLVATGAWLVAFGASRPRLPSPLARRAMVGGLGYLLIAATIVLASQTQVALLVVAFAFAVSVLGFLFGLIDLDRLTASPSH
jgi:hypothetical protein